jgi:hypothetical protein
MTPKVIANYQRKNRLGSPWLLFFNDSGSSGSEQKKPQYPALWAAYRFS